MVTPNSGYYLKKNSWRLYPMNYAYGFSIWLCFFVDSQMCLPISFSVTSLALGQSYDCPSASEVTLKDMGQASQYLSTTKHNKAWTLSIFLGRHCNYTLGQPIWLDSPCPSICRRHGSQSITSVCFGISISNFICTFPCTILLSCPK